MRFLHIADLHIGKILHQHSFLPDQKLILAQILQIAKDEAVDAVLIAGDVYQRNNPSSEAMTVFSDFLAALASAHIPCYMIAGNHDSAARVAYLSEIAEQAGIYIAGVDAAAVYTYTAADEYGKICIHLMPYCTPLLARVRFPEQQADIRSYEDAVRAVLAANPIDKSARNVLVCHQYLTGAATCDSEELAIGGLDNISASLFDNYDYVALGHLHGAQKVQRETVRYAGSPLKYSFSEETHRKSVTIADLREKGEIEVRTVPLSLPHDMRTLTGSFAEISQAEPSEDYLRIVLTDELPPQDAAQILRGIFPNLLQLSVLNSKTRESRTTAAAASPAETDFLSLLREFYAFQNQGAVLSDAQEKLVLELSAELDREAGDPA